MTNNRKMKIEDGREKFYQWDSGQRLIVEDGVCNAVHFTNSDREKSLVCSVVEENGRRTVSVPNILLQSDKMIRAYACVSDEEGAATAYCCAFEVIKRSRPEDYIYTETEVLSYGRLDGRISALEKQGTVGSAYTIPDYWQTAVDSAVSKVKALQDVGGRDIVNFALFSDMHYGDNTAKIQHLGHLCAAVMDKCDIPLVINCGDTMTSSPLSSESAVLTNLDNGTALLSPVPMESYAQIYGNHDDVWGQSNGISYVNKVAPEKMWNRMFRKQTKDRYRVFGGNGTYFYIDNVPQKVRFIGLNSHYYDREAVTSGTTKIMTTGFGAEQLAWLKNTALNVEDGWSVVIATHVPPTAEAINGRTDYLSQIADGASFRTIVAETRAKLIGIFCGHCHTSAIVTGDLPCPVVTVTTAGGVPYDDAEGERTAGTTTELAFDVVSVNKAEEKIYLTRLGIGNDRVCSYSELVIATYIVANNLTNATSNNSTSVAEQGQPYIATLTAASGCELSAVTVTMGGTDITSSVYTDGAINIASVTGDIVITATATEIAVKPSYTNLADPASVDWSNDDRLGSSGTPKGPNTNPGHVVTNWIPATKGDVIRIKGINIADATGGYAVWKKEDGSLEVAKPSSYSAGFVQDTNGVWTFTVWLLNPSGTMYGDGCQGVRFSGVLTVSSANDVIITVNELIP